MTKDVSAQPPGLIGVGYEGQTLPDLIRHLTVAGVSRLVDVRLTPISRKPGLSKTALGRALTEAGIAYEHRRELGNPRTNRAGFAGSPEQVAQARETFRALLERPASAASLDALAAAGRCERIAVLCFEAEQGRCHRDVVLDEARRRTATAWASTHRAR